MGFRKWREDERKRRFVAMLFGTVGSFLSSFTALSVQLAVAEMPQVSMYQLMFVRKLITSVLAIPYALVSGVTWSDFKTRDIIVPISVASVTNYAASLFGVFSLFFVTLSNYYTIRALNVFITQAFSWCVLGEVISCTDGVFAMIAVVGVVFVVQPEAIFGIAAEHVTMDHKESSFALGIGLVLLSNFFTAMSYVYARIAYRKTNPSMFLLAEGLSGMIITAFIMLSLGQQFLFPKTLYSYMIQSDIGVGIFLTNFTMHLAVKLDNAVILAIVRNADILFAIGFQKMFFNIEINTMAAIAAVIVVSSLVALVITRSIRKAKEK